MQRQHELGMTVYRTGNIIARFLSNELSGLGISYTQAIILCKLAEKPSKSVTQKELKEYLEVTSASLSCVLKRMIKIGFLQLKADVKDNRVNIVSLTQKGADLVPRVSACLDKVDEKIYAGFSQNEMETFYSSLCRVQNNLSDDSNVEQANNKEFFL